METRKESRNWNYKIIARSALIATELIAHLPHVLVRFPALVRSFIRPFARSSPLLLLFGLICAISHNVIIIFCKSVDLLVSFLVQGLLKKLGAGADTWPLNTCEEEQSSQTTPRQKLICRDYEDFLEFWTFKSDSYRPYFRFCRSGCCE